MEKKHWVYLGSGFYALNVFLLSQEYDEFLGWPLLFGGIERFFSGNEIYPIHLQVLMPTIGCVAAGSLCLVKASKND